MIDVARIQGVGAAVRYTLYANAGSAVIGRAALRNSAGRPAATLLPLALGPMV